jgi:RNA polymerase sigma factor (TIGR02999 family)
MSGLRPDSDGRAPAGGEITAQLRAGSAGDTRAMAAAFSDLYATLRQLASHVLAGERRNHTLQTSGLIAEAYFRLIEQQRIQWSSREHFVATAARMMRRILVDYARGRAAAKRDPGAPLAALDQAAPLAVDQLAGVVAIHDALAALEGVSEKLSVIVELRFFGGLTNEEIAGELGISLPTVERRWRVARAWLYRHLTCAGP